MYLKFLEASFFVRYIPWARIQCEASSSTPTGTVIRQMMQMSKSGLNYTVYSNPGTCPCARRNPYCTPSRCLEEPAVGWLIQCRRSIGGLLSTWSFMYLPQHHGERFTKFELELQLDTIMAVCGCLDNVAGTVDHYFFHFSLLIVWSKLCLFLFYSILQIENQKLNFEVYRFHF